MTLLLDQEQITNILTAYFIADGRVTDPKEITITYTGDFMARVQIERKK